MPQPTISAVHVNRPLTNISVAYLQQARNFVADKVFPKVPSPNQSNVYFEFDRAYFYKTEARNRAPGTESAGSGFNISNTTFTCLRDAVHKDIADPIRANADQPLDLDMSATQWATLQMMIKMESRWATSFFGTGIWDNTITQGAGSWNLAASTPIEDIRNSARTILTNTGYYPNTLVLGMNTFDKLIDHPDIIDRLKAGQTPGGPAVANEDALARIWGLDRVMVCRAVQNTAVEAATPSYSAIVGTTGALLVYAAPAPGIMQPSAGYTFTWSGQPGGDNAYGLRIKSFRIERLESTRIEAEAWYTYKTVAAALGAFGTGLVS